MCETVSPDSTETCECGYSFVQAGTVGRVQLGAAARRNMVVGGLILVAGLAVTLLTMAASSAIGFYVVAWGAVVFGGGQFIRGVIQARRQRRLGK